jgi:hypothetical protein
MKLKLLVKLGELLLGDAFMEEQKKADMYLPAKLLAMFLVMTVLGLGLAVFAVLNVHLWAGLGAVACIVLGIGAFMCWKNQKIIMVSDEIFCYRTFLGYEHEYRFSQIQRAVQNQDSITLILDTGKVHIESMAVLSDRLVERIDRELAKTK